METQKNENKPQQLTKGFNPDAFEMERVGINPITIEKNETIYIEVLSPKVEIYTMVNNDEVDFVKAIDLKTGEEGHFWLAGQLRHQFQKLADINQLQGSKFKITSLGKTPTEILNPDTNKIEKVEVNQFDIFKLREKQ